MIMRQPQQSGAFQVHGISRQKTETYAGRTDGRKADSGQDMCRFYGCLLC